MHLKQTLGYSSENRPIDLYTFQAREEKAKILFLGAVHGDEVESHWLLEAVIKQWSQTYSGFEIGVTALICSPFNVDGFANQTRTNARHIDLNRNLPTQDWTAEIKNPRYPPGPHAGSEPETKVFLNLLDAHKPTAILSAHSFSQFQVNSNGPSLEWAKALAKICNYPVTEDIGYPTPGSLGTYAGKERKIPTITLEIERGLSQEKVLSLHLPVIDETLRYWSKQK